MFLQIDPTIDAATKAVPIIYQLGIGGVLLVVIFFSFYKIWNYFTVKEKETKEELKLIQAAYEKEKTELREINQKLTTQLLAQAESYASTLLSHEKANLLSINDITNSLNNLSVVLEDIKRKYNE